MFACVRFQIVRTFIQKLKRLIESPFRPVLPFQAFIHVRFKRRLCQAVRVAPVHVVVFIDRSHSFRCIKGVQIKRRILCKTNVFKKVQLVFLQQVAPVQIPPHIPDEAGFVRLFELAFNIPAQQEAIGRQLVAGSRRLPYRNVYDTRT